MYKMHLWFFVLLNLSLASCTERIVVVIDQSGSMYGQPIRIQQAKAYGKSKNPSDIWRFNTECKQYSSIDELESDGGTRIGNALNTVFKDMEKFKHYDKQTLYFMTDAQDFMSDSDEEKYKNMWEDLKKNGAVGTVHFFGTPGDCKTQLHHTSDKFLKHGIFKKFQTASGHEVVSK